MSAGNVQIVRELIERWNDGEMVFTQDTVHPDVEWLPRRAGTEGAYRGIGGMESFVADTLETFESFKLNPAEVLDLGDRVLIWGTIRFRARQSGLEAEIPFGGLVAFREGLITRWEDFGSRDAALAAAAQP